MAQLTHNFGVDCYQYADDTQLLISFDQTDLNAKLALLTDCSYALHDWFLSNGLALNPDKSKAILLGTTARKRSLNVGDHVTIA